MLCEVKTAGAAGSTNEGKFTLGACYGFRIEPWENAPEYPLTAYLDGSSQAVVVDDDRPFTVAAESIQVEGAPPSSKWLVTSATAPGETLPEGGRRVRPVRLFSYRTQANVVVSVQSPIANEVALPTLDQEGLYDVAYSVSRFSGFCARVGFGSGIGGSGGDPMVRVVLALNFDNAAGETAGPVIARRYERALSLPITSYSSVLFEFGQGIADYTADDELRRGLRWMDSVSLYLSIDPFTGGAENITFAGGLWADLWGIP